MIRRPPRLTRTATPFPNKTLFRSDMPKAGSTEFGGMNMPKPGGTVFGNGDMPKRGGTGDENGFGDNMPGTAAATALGGGEKPYRYRSASDRKSTRLNSSH